MSDVTAIAQREAGFGAAGLTGGAPADYVSLLKPRVMSLVILTALAGLVAAPTHVHPVIGFAALLAISVGAGASGALNMWYDRDIDAVMKRTEKRPLVQGVLTPQEALTFAIGIEVVGFLMLAVFVNMLSAVFALSGALFYAFVYTMWLKRKSPSNIVIGGAAGGFPVLVGWAAVANGVSLAPWVMFAIIFFWTPPHFWALAFKYRDDYSAAKVPMLPSVAPMSYTAFQITTYSVLLLALSLLLAPVAQLGEVYILAAVVLGVVFCGFAVKLQRNHSEHTAMTLFAYSITYVTLLFGAMVVDQFVSVF